MVELFSDIYSYSFMQNALLIGVFGGALLAFLGIFIHLKRIVFFGAALPQIIALGIGFSAFLSIPTYIGSFLFGLVSIILLNYHNHKSPINTESVNGILFAAGSSISIILIALSSESNAFMLKVFHGDILGSTLNSAIAVAILCMVILCLFKVFWSRIVISLHDQEIAKTLGIKVKIWDLLFLLSLITSLSFIMSTTGSILSFCMLIGPSAAALLLSKNLNRVIIIALILGPLCALLGLSLSYLYDLPSGPTMASIALVPIIIAWPINLLKFKSV